MCFKDPTIVEHLSQADFTWGFSRVWLGLRQGCGSRRSVRKLPCVDCYNTQDLPEDRDLLEERHPVDCIVKDTFCGVCSGCSLIAHCRNCSAL